MRSFAAKKPTTIYFKNEKDDDFGALILHCCWRQKYPPSFHQAFTMTANLADFQSTLERLHAYEKPEALIASPAMETDEEQESSQGSLQRYEKARDEYLKRRTQQVFYEHLSTFDGNSVSIPEAPSEEEQEDSKRLLHEAQERLEATVRSANEKHQQLQTKYDIFVHRREDISRMIADMKDSSFDMDDNHASDDKENEDFNEEALAAEEQKCNDLTQRRAELLQRLARKRAELTTKERKLDEMNQQMSEISSKVAPVTMANVEEYEAETEEMRKHSAKYTEMMEWYDGMREMLEDITGIKILGVKNAEGSAKIMVLKVQLLVVHQVEIRMKKDPRRPNTLRVDSATFLTSDTVQGEMVDNKALELTIPDLKDLVRLCINMGPVKDLQFLLRETMARIRAIVARVDELSILRAGYLTKIGALQHSAHSFGGEDQEVVCSISEGVTVVLRLTPDCPIVAGSSYVDQIVGVGGWDPSALENLKQTINIQRHRGPVKLMDSLKQELDRLQQEGEISVPTTPKMLRRMLK